MRSRRRSLLLALGLALAAGSGVAAFLAWQARRPFWLEDPGHKSWVAHLAFSLTGKPIATISTPGLRTFTVSPASDVIAAGDDEALAVRLFSFDGVERGKRALPAAPDAGLSDKLSSREREIDGLAFAPDGRTLAAIVRCGGVGRATGASFSWVVLWDLDLGKPVPIVDSRIAASPTTTDNQRAATAVAFSPAGDLVAVAFGKRVYVFRVA